MKLFSVFIFAFISSIVFSQETLSTDIVKDTLGIPTHTEIISGTITDESDVPLYGVNIIIKGSSIGTETNAEGQYSINAKQGDTLVFSYVSMLTVETMVETSHDISFSMKEDAEMLETVVLDNTKITKEEKASTYGSAEISSKQISKGGFYTSIGQLLVERGIRVRGETAFFKSDKLLLVIDNVVISQDVADLDNVINTEDIEKINAIRSTFGYEKYGESAIGGVVEITTKFKNKGLLKNKKTNKQYFI